MNDYAEGPMEPKETRKKRYEPTDADWQLRGFRVEEAENGVVVDCEYRLNDATKKKTRDNEKMGLGYISEYKNTKSVFEKESEAKSFIIAELDKLWSN